ncbi:YheC/D like ATP-grasp [Gracilibacillus ureilyticus]|uniref:YheC/D like ATP-grasp n=1 Tax=Gracilibacillus ureilyticus TaxID=531814 RepID=A0A1H9SIR3_9BACI|nr:YheC/YheD family protein [Gracilibacillus ureilyticus]SER84936.1 YheC/D like ATP-grasp [Gracilibacillus ureilyticus]
MIYELQVREYPNTRNRIIVPGSIYTLYKKVRRMVNGPNYVYCDWLSHNKDNHTIFISSELMKQLQFKSNKIYPFRIINHSCMVYYQLGILTAGWQQIERHSDLFEEMTQIGRSYGFDTLLFGYKDIDFNVNKIKCHYFDEDQWTSTILPFPKVIYNRLPNRKLEAHPAVKQTKQILQTTSIIFNPDFFNKWQVYKIFMQNHSVHYLLPHTVFQPSFQTFAEWIDIKDIYLKPVYGSKGNGIFHMFKKNDKYIVRYYTEKKADETIHSTVDSIIDNYFPNGFKNYVIQEAIPLFTSGNKKIDLRVHTNKNDENKWDMSLHYARQVEEHLITTHVSRGAVITSLFDFFSEKDATMLLNKVEKIAISLSEIIDEDYHYKLGELGFDFGIDHEKKIWLLEVNAKPGWNVFNHPAYQHTKNKVFQLLYKYAFYLEGKKV